MKLTKYLLLSAVILSLFAPLVAQAQGNIGVINLRQVFDEYYKRSLADAQIKKRAAELDEERESMIRQYQALEAEMKELTESAADFGASLEERNRRKAAADAKQVQMRAKETQINQFNTQARELLSEQSNRMRNRVMDEISDVVRAEAEASGYFLVLDIDAETINKTKMVVFHNGQNDITRKIITRLNADAPPGFDPKAAPVTPTSLPAPAGQ